MGQYERHIFVCTTGDRCPVQGDGVPVKRLLYDPGVPGPNKVE